MKINIISVDNRVGLSQDIRILKEILEKKHEVNVIDIYNRRVVKQKAIINIWLEVLDHRYFGFGDYNILIPNPEWFYTAWSKWLKQINEIWVKTQDAAKIFKPLHNDIKYISWTSRDRYDQSIERKPIFLHIAGRSETKGTKAIIQAWTDKMPKLWLITEKKYYTNNSQIKPYYTWLKSEEIKQLQNRCLYHVCTSEYEGFGHYINEAKSCGGHIITTNAEPMKSIIKTNYLVNVKSTIRPRGRLGILNKIDPMHLREVVSKVNDKKINAKNRQDFLDNDKFFREQINQLI